MAPKAYEDLRAAIAANVFKKAADGTAIIDADERSSMDWLFDFRALLLQAHWLNRYAEIFWEAFASQYPFQICGMETAAISMVSAIVMKGVERGTPVNGLYIRKSRKRQGLLKQIEGVSNGEKIILVDDLINSASTFTKQIKILRDSDEQVSQVFALLSFRELPTYDSLDVPVKTLFTLPDFGLPFLHKTPAQSTDAFEVVWKYKAQRPLRNFVHEKSNLVLDANLVYFGTDSEGLLAFDQEEGSIVWRSNLGNEHSPSAIFSTPNIYKDSLYIGSQNGNLCALDKTTGAVRWIYDDADSIQSSSILALRLQCVFVGIEYGLFRKHGALAAIDMNTGEKRWQARMPGRVRGSPYFIEKEGMVVAGDDAGNVCGYAAENGRPIFHLTVNGGMFGGCAYDEKRRVIYFGSAGGVLHGVFVPTGEVVFAKQTLGIYSTPFIADDTLFFSSLDKNIYAIDLKDMSDKWRYKTQGRIFASPSFEDNSLWCGSNDGKLYEFDADTGQLRSTFQFSERIVNKIAYSPATKRFYVSTQANELYCLKRK